jgi:DNA-binding beta-propeller fold protein YncE
MTVRTRRHAAILVAAGLVALAAPVDAARSEVATKNPNQFQGEYLVGDLLPTGVRITPLAGAGASFKPLNPNLAALPDFVAGQAVEIAVSPDGQTILVLTSGFNRNFGPDGRYVPALSNEYVFVFDVSGHEAIKRQVIEVPNTFLGIAWQGDNTGFFVAGGKDDNVHVYRRDGATFIENGVPIPLHTSGNGVNVKPMAGGLAISPDGKRLLVANVQSDSVSLIDIAARKVIAERDLRPGKIDKTKAGTPGGEFPLSVVFATDDKAYVGSARDREIISLEIGSDSIAVSKRIAIAGQPVKLIVNKDRSRAFVAADNSDTVVVLDTHDDDVIAEFQTAAPPAIFRNAQGLRGASPNNLALSPDERTLFVTNAGLNAVAVVALGADIFKDDEKRDADAEKEEAKPATKSSGVIGLIPTGWYPNAVAVAREGHTMYIVNGKSNAGPNPNGCQRTRPRSDAAVTNACVARNEYIWQLSKAGLLSLPVPDAKELARLTRQTALNDNFPSVKRYRHDTETMEFLRHRIKHIVYIVKENRTYDQVLGDLKIGNGDPSLTLFPEPVTPNHHALAGAFVTLDHFLDSGETSNTGWQWTTAARSNDYSEKNAPVNYARRGLQYDQEGENRNINVGIASLAERRAANPATPDDPDLVPGTADVAAPDPSTASGGGAGTGYLWDAALRAGLTIRNYGFFGDLARYSAADDTRIPLTPDPFAEKRQVFFPTKASLVPHTDLYYRGFDQAFADFYLVKEWQREFAEQVEKAAMPNLTLLRIAHDHFGDFDKAMDGVNTPELQMADNDFALGTIVATVAASPFAKDTLLFVVEDDAQDGADHVDAHRSIALIVGPYVRKAALISKAYTTVNALRTMEAILGLPPLGLNDGLAEPMTDVFDPAETDWSYQAKLPEILRMTRLPLDQAAPAKRSGSAAPCFAAPKHGAQYWETVMAGQDFSAEDRLDTARFNAALWTGLKGGTALSPQRSGADLRRGRKTLIAQWRKSLRCDLARR